MPSTHLETVLEGGDGPGNEGVADDHEGPARTRRDARLALCLERSRGLEHDGEDDEERGGQDRPTHLALHTGRDGRRERESGRSSVELWSNLVRAWRPTRRSSFSPFALDLASERLLRGSRSIPLRPKSFAVLRYLAEHPGRLVTPDELLAAIWPDVHVGRGLPKDSVLETRRALGDRPRTPRFIETAHGRGYRFVARVSRGGEGAAWDTADTIPGIVGRQAEMGRLSAALDRAQRGARQLLFISGEAGIGKTTLLEAFRQRLAGSALWSAPDSASSRREAYLPVLEALGRLCREPGRVVAGGGTSHAGAELACADARRYEDAAPAAAGSTHAHAARAGRCGRGDDRRPLVLVLKEYARSDQLDARAALGARPANTERARLLIVGEL